MSLAEDGSFIESWVIARINYAALGVFSMLLVRFLDHPHCNMGLDVIG